MSFFKKLRSTLSNSRRADQGVLNPVYRNDDSEEVRFTSIHQTEVKTPFTSYDPQSGPSTEVPQSDKQQPKTIFSWLTFTLFTVLVLGAITAIVIVIVALRDPTPPNKKNAPVCISKVEIPLMYNIVINCELNDYKSDKLTIAVTTPKVGSKPEYLAFESSVKNQIWTMNESSELSVQIWGPEIQCNSYGTYQINFTVPGKDVVTQNVTIAMSSILPKVNLTLDRATSCTADGNSTDLLVSCATWSGCNIRSLNIMPIAENGSVSDFELQFECKTNYTNEQGWYVNCSGRINDAPAKTKNKVQCYPSSGQPESIDLTPCNLTDRCTAKDTKLGENISIICNFSTALSKNINITVCYPSPSNETVVLTNETISNKGWTMNFTPDQGNQSLTLTGPPARCSSAGKYLIKINDTDLKKSRSQNVTVEIKGSTKLNATNTSNSSATCESRTACNGHYTLRIEPSYISLLSNISQNCNTMYSDSDGWITTCRGTPLSAYNVSSKCTLSENKDIEPDKT